MIQVIAGGISLHPYITSYDVDIKPNTSGNNFTAHDGVQIAKVMGHTTVISLTMEKVPHGTAKAVAEVVKAESFEMTYTSPIVITSNFKCTKYNAKPKNADPRQKNPLITDNLTWTIQLTVESADSGENDGGGL